MDSYRCGAIRARQLLLRRRTKFCRCELGYSGCYAMPCGRQDDSGIPHRHEKHGPGERSLGGQGLTVIPDIEPILIH